MSAIFKKEFSSYFYTGIGYTIVAVFVFFSALFYTSCLYYQSASINEVFSNILVLMIFLAPIMTMRLFSEEKKQKTEQLLFTSPVNTAQIVLGKYFAAVLLYFVCSLIFIVYGIINSFFGTPEWSVIICNFIGTFLWGSAFISLGIFFSSLTENQVIAAVISAASGLIICMINNIAANISSSLISLILRKISFYYHYSSFSSGILSLRDITFFVSVSVIFIFLTVCVIKRKSR